MTHKRNEYQPKTGQPCSCRKGQQRDNCPNCEGTGMRIDFAAIRARNTKRTAKERLEYLRGELRAERISYGELSELQSLAAFIDKDDIELREAAGIAETETVKPAELTGHEIGGTLQQELIRTANVMTAEKLIALLRKVAPDTRVIDADGLSPTDVEVEDEHAVLIFDPDAQYGAALNEHNRCDHCGRDYSGHVADDGIKFCTSEDCPSYPRGEEIGILD